MIKKDRDLLKEKCDTLWSLLVKIKVGYKCEKCGSKNGIQSHHIFKRKHMATRFVIENGMCLCFVCHEWVEKNPKRFSDWAVFKIGNEMYESLDRLHRQIHQPNFQTEYERLKGIEKEFQERDKNGK